MKAFHDVIPTVYVVRYKRVDMTHQFVAIYTDKLIANSLADVCICMGNENVSIERIG